MRRQHVDVEDQQAAQRFVLVDVLLDVELEHGVQARHVLEALYGLNGQASSAEELASELQLTEFEVRRIERQLLEGVRDRRCVHPRRDLRLAA